MPANKVTGIILSGGRGKRLEGRDKGLVNYQSRPLISHCIDDLQPQVDALLISCNRNLDKYLAFGFALITDKRKDFQGPLAGVEAALRQCETDLAMIWPVDSLPIPDGLVSAMRDELEKSDADIVYLHQPHKSQYLIALMRTSLSQSLSEFLDSGQRKVRDWYATQQTVVSTEFSDIEIKNLNMSGLFQNS